jgi:hypothetical protein
MKLVTTKRGRCDDYVKDGNSDSEGYERKIRRGQI